MAPERVKDEFGGSIDEDVQFRLMIELDNKDIFKRVVDVFDVDLIDAALVANLERCRARIKSIAALGDGWRDGDGLAVSEKAVVAAEKLLAARPRLAGSYHIYPTDEGGILFEFVLAGWDYAIEAKSHGAVEIYGVQMEGSANLDSKEFAGVDAEALKFLDSLAGDPL